MNTFGPIRTLALFFVAAPLLLLLGCGIFDSEKGEVRPIEGNIIFRFEEDYQDHGTISEPRITLSMVTEKWYPCINWSIRCQQTVQNEEIFIRFFGIYVPEGCYTAFGPATARKFLGISTGEYLVHFSYKNATDSHSLTVTDSSIEITEHTSQFTKPKSKLLWRYPPSSFAYLCGTTTETSWICEDSWTPCSVKSTWRNSSFLIPVKSPIPARVPDTITTRQPDISSIRRMRISIKQARY